MTNEDLSVSLRVLRNVFADSETKFRNHDIRNLEYVIEKIEKGEWSCENQTPQLTRADILNKAKECVCGQREQDYGTPESNFQLIADLWNTYLGLYRQMDKPINYSDDAVQVWAIPPLTPTDVAMMMALLKIARIKNGGGTGDSFVDLAGYAACGGELNSIDIEVFKGDDIPESEKTGLFSDAFENDNRLSHFCDNCKWKDEASDGEHCDSCCHNNTESVKSNWEDRLVTCANCVFNDKTSDDYPCNKCSRAGNGNISNWILNKIGKSK